METHTKSARRSGKRSVSEDDLVGSLNAFRSLVQVLRIAERSSIASYGLGSAQIYVLQRLRDAAPMTINQLADATSTDQSSVSVVVDKLVRKGLISRDRGRDDARKVEVNLTTAGRAALRKLKSSFQETFLDAVKSLGGDDAAELRRLLSILAKNLGGTEKPAMLFEDSSGAKKRSSRKK